jgi:hypothetical protein
MVLTKNLVFVLLPILAIVLGQATTPDDNPNPPFDQTTVTPTLTITETISNDDSTAVVTVTLPNSGSTLSGASLLLIVLFISTLLALMIS